MCISGALVALDRGMLVPPGAQALRGLSRAARMARKEMEDLRRLLAERLGEQTKGCRPHVDRSVLLYTLYT